MKPDSQLQQDAMDELKWEPAAHAAQIGLEVKNGVVTLAGKVSSSIEKLNAERAARRAMPSWAERELAARSAWGSMAAHALSWTS